MSRRGITNIMRVLPKLLSIPVGKCQYLAHKRCICTTLSGSAPTQRQGCLRFLHRTLLSFLPLGVLNVSSSFYPIYFFSYFKDNTFECHPGFIFCSTRQMFPFVCVEMYEKKEQNLCYGQLSTVVVFFYVFFPHSFRSLLCFGWAGRSLRYFTRQIRSNICLMIWKECV